jgi:hypothetical protein
MVEETRAIECPFDAIDIVPSASEATPPTIDAREASLGAAGRSCQTGGCEEEEFGDRVEVE